MGNYTSMSTQGETIESSIEKFNSKLEELEIIIIRGRYRSEIKLIVFYFIYNIYFF